MAGFNPKEYLWCEGVIGDGCGGGRIFYIKDASLYAYDPNTQESMLLFEGVANAQTLRKKGCRITIECVAQTIVFDLSLLQEVSR